MPEPWFAVEAAHRRSKKLAELRNDSARYGFFVALGECKLLYQAGSFTPGQWKALMGTYAKYLKDYLAVGLIHVAPTFCSRSDQAVCLRGRGPFPAGQLVIHNWSKYQREHAARQADYRNKSDDGSDADSDARSDVQSDADSDFVVTPSHAGALRAVPVPVSVDSLSTTRDEPYQVRNGILHVDVETAAIGEGITGHTFLSAGTAQMTELDRLIEDHGPAAVRASMVRVADGRRRSWRQLVWDAVKDLEPFAQPVKHSAADIEKARIDAIVAQHGGKGRPA